MLAEIAGQILRCQGQMIGDFRNGIDSGGVFRNVKKDILQQFGHSVGSGFYRLSVLQAFADFVKYMQKMAEGTEVLFFFVVAIADLVEHV